MKVHIITVPLWFRVHLVHTIPVATSIGSCRLISATACLRISGVNWAEALDEYMATIADIATVRMRRCFTRLFISTRFEVLKKEVLINEKRCVLHCVIMLLYLCFDNVAESLSLVNGRVDRALKDACGHFLNPVGGLL